MDSKKELHPSLCQLAGEESCSVGQLEMQTAQDALRCQESECCTWLGRDFGFSTYVDVAKLLKRMLWVCPQFCYDRHQLFLIWGKGGQEPGKVFEKWKRQLLGAALETLE